MHHAAFPLSAATTAELAYLHGKSVLVRSSIDHRNPPTARRGWLEVRLVDGAPRVQIALEFPQMFQTCAHGRTLTLDEEAVERLLESEREGAFALTIEGPLDPEAPPGNE